MNTFILLFLSIVPIFALGQSSPYIPAPTEYDGNSATTTSLDKAGSMGALYFVPKTKGRLGSTYKGSVEIHGTIFQKANGACPKGQIEVFGQGYWNGGYGDGFAKFDGKVGYTSQDTDMIGTIAQLSLIESSSKDSQQVGQVKGLIFQGLSPYQQDEGELLSKLHSTYFFQGVFGTPCEPTGVGM